MLVLVLLQLPPVVALLRFVVELAHTDAVPVIVPAFGSGLTVATRVVAAEPQALVTV
jgi:hypothetical protein